MPTEDGFAPNHPLPLFLSKRADEDVPQDRPVFSPRILATSILVVVATAVGLGVLSVGHPMTLFADVTASLFDIAALQPRTDPVAPAPQSTADTQALSPATRDAPRRDEMAAAVEPADQSQNAIRPPSAETLLKQFQAWAADEDARAQVRLVEPVQRVQEAPAQIAPVQVADDAETPVRPMHRHRRLRPAQNARAEMRPVHSPRARLRQAQNARAQVRPVQDPRAQDQAAQNAQAPSFLQSLGVRQ
jgi:hypothetical protein